MEDDKRSSDIGNIGDGRFSFQNSFGPWLPGVASKIVWHQPPGVSFPEKGRQVIYAPLSAGGLETMIMPDDPGRKVAGIGASADHQPGGIRPALRHCLVQHRQYIAGGPRTPVLYIG